MAAESRETSVAALFIEFGIEKADRLHKGWRDSMTHSFISHMVSSEQSIRAYGVVRAVSSECRESKAFGTRTREKKRREDSDMNLHQCKKFAGAH